MALRAPRCDMYPRNLLRYTFTHLSELCILSGFRSMHDCPFPYIGHVPSHHWSSQNQADSESD
jgi:hypothetical protein